MTTSKAPNHATILVAVPELQALGWRVVPIEGGSERKPPMTYKDLANLDPSDPQFLDNFNKYPECPAIAKIVAPDEIVIDIDGGEWPDMPVTPTVKTPRGFHYHLKRPAGLEMPGATLNCGDGFEVKASGMLTNIPPGHHSSGVDYTWKHGPETPLAEPPQWVIDKINDHYAKTRTKKGTISKQEIDRLSRGVEGGERNDAMMRYGGHLVGKGKEWPEIKKTLEDWNQKNTPPLDSKGFKTNLRSLETMCQKRAQEKGQKETSSPGMEKFSAEVCGEMVQRVQPLFIIRDTLEFYIYEKGIFRNIGTRKTAQPIRQLIRKLLKAAPIKGEETDTANVFIGAVLTYLEDTYFVERQSLQNHQNNLICLENGVYDRSTGQLLPHSPAYRFLTKIPVSYDPDAKCPAILKFMSEVVSPEHVTTIFEFFGYCLIPDTSIQKALLFVGEGANGKSVLIKLLERFVGTDNISKESLQALETDPYAVAELFGKLLNTCADLSSKALYENSTIKQLVGNDGEIRARKIYSPPFRFKNTAKLVFSVNNAPPVPDDPAYFRRWLIIPFPNKFEGDKADRNLDSKLQTEEELSGLLNIALAALDNLMRKGQYAFSPSTEEIQKIYKIKSDHIAAFANECLVYSEDDTSKAIVLEHYATWCKDHKIKPKPENEFAKRMKKMGYESSRPHSDDGSRERVWHGVTIKDPSIQGSGPGSVQAPAPQESGCRPGGPGSKSHCCSVVNSDSLVGGKEGEKSSVSGEQHIENSLDRLGSISKPTLDRPWTKTPTESDNISGEGAGGCGFTPQKYPIIVVPLGEGSRVVNEQLILLAASR